jgi:hypothetical protein
MRTEAIRACAVCVALCALQFTSPPARAETVTCTTSGQVTTCRVAEPNVKQRLTSYSQITLKGGDSVTVQAGGCVQTGGIGRTWKRYVWTAQSGLEPAPGEQDCGHEGAVGTPGQLRHGQTAGSHGNDSEASAGGPHSRCSGYG